jgi:RNA polymerase sigma factor (sigma-70 family)
MQSVISRGASIYLAEIRRFPMLEAEEEHVLATRWRECGDENAALQLLTSHLRLVAKISMDYRRYGRPTSDLISEGNVGLIQAMKRFDPDRGIRFSTYAVWWIKASILRLHHALVVAREDRNHRQSEEALFQFVQGEAPNIRASPRRFAPREGNAHCQ